MSRIGYIVRKIFKVDYKSMINAAKTIHKKRGKSTLSILKDMAYCGAKYGCGYSDYVEFEFDLIDEEQRKTYLTSDINAKIINKYNDKEYRHIFGNKYEFNGIFKKYIKRDYISVEFCTIDDFMEFLKNRNQIIVKPLDQTSGEGIEIIDINSKTNVKELYNNLREKKQFLVEEVVIQHPRMSSLFEKSVNTLRIISFLKDDGEVEILRSVLKIGTRVGIDNSCNGGMYTFLDENGVVIMPAFDDYDNRYTTHPTSGTMIVGFKIPFYKAAEKLIKEAGKVVPQIRYVGWDVAITKDGPLIIEGNEYCGLFQMKPSLSENKQGDLVIFKRYMDI